MNKRLFNDNGGETLTPDGHIWRGRVAAVLRPLINKAVNEGVSIRDLTAVVVDEITVVAAENLIRGGIKERAEFSAAIKENRSNHN